MEINEQIYWQNPWWRDPQYHFREENWSCRQIFAGFLKEVKELRQISGLTGPRRTGKSTLLKQVMADLLKKGLPPKLLLYFSFDQPLAEQKTETLEKVVLFYLRKILQTEIHSVDDKVYLFFDEIQSIPDWQMVLKRFYDLNPNLKFIISGSASLFLQNAPQESLAGRIFLHYLPPLSFEEYRTISKNRDFEVFLEDSQFPETALLPDSIKRKEYLRESVINRVLKIDIPKIFSLRNLSDIERLFWVLVSNSGQIIQSRRLAAELGLKKTTFHRYLAILEDSLLMNKVLNLSGSFRSEARLLRKYYPGSVNFSSLLPETVGFGFKIEAYVASLLKNKHGDLYFYHERGKEIDFLLPRKKLAIEVKYQNIIHESDYAFLRKFIREKKWQGLVITKNLTKKIPGENLRLLSLEDWESEQTSEKVSQ